MLKRKPVPELIPQKMKMARFGVLSKSFATGRDNFVRIREGQIYKVKARFNETVSSDVIVMLHTNVPSSVEEYDKWRLIQLVKEEDGSYGTSIQVKGSGVFKLKIKYSLDGGTSWLWDRGPFGYLFVEPKNSDSVRVYTLIPNQSGCYNDWKEKLVAIKDMGFNYVHLLPVTAMDESRSPYSAKYLFRPDDQYKNPNDMRSSLDQFEDFVEEAKRLEIGLCIDLVVNHVGVSSEIAITNPNWIQVDTQESDGLKRAGWGDYNLWYKWEDLVLLNYDHENKRIRRNIWEYMKDYVIFWSNYAAYTGGMIRLDNFHSSNEKFVSFMMYHLRKEYPELIVLAEFFANEETMNKTTLNIGLNLLLTTSWSAKFAPQVRSHLKYLHQIYGKMRYFYPINSHDSGTPAEEFANVYATLPRYVLSALYSVGHTGIVQGVEFGAKHKVEFINQNNKLSFEDTGIDFREFIKKVNGIMNSYSEFRTGGNLNFVDRGHDAILAAVRSGGESGAPLEGVKDYYGFLLLVNLDTNAEQCISLHFDSFKLDFENKENLRLEELLEGYSMEVNIKNDVNFILKAGESKVFKILKTI